MLNNLIPYYEYHFNLINDIQVIGTLLDVLDKFIVLSEVTISIGDNSVFESYYVILKSSVVSVSAFEGDNFDYLLKAQFEKEL